MRLMQPGCLRLSVCIGLTFVVIKPHTITSAEDTHPIHFMLTWHNFGTILHDRNPVWVGQGAIRVQNHIKNCIENRMCESGFSMQPIVSLTSAK